MQPSIQDDLIDTLASSRRVFVFTGAGASKESGLPTFRDTDGDWKKYDPMTYATLDGFLANPVAVWNMYRMRQKQIEEAQPNPGHVALARMEHYYSEFLVVTQNVDDLHERAGSARIVKIHGDAWQMRCMKREDVFDCRDFDLPEEFTRDTLPSCPKCGALCRPNIVWFGEFVPSAPMMTALSGAGSCDLMLIIGTSGEVSNGYGFAECALANNARIVEINPARGALTKYAHFWIPEPSGVVLPRIWQILTGEQIA